MAARVVELSNTQLAEEIQRLCQKYGAKGGILVVETEESIKIATDGLNVQQMRTALCLSIYYNEKVAMEDRISDVTQK